MYVIAIGSAGQPTLSPYPVFPVEPGEHVVLTPYPHQIEGAAWLAERKHALLADQPRVGKTGTAIMAADDNLESSILVVTTASGRAVWRRAFAQWSPFKRPDLRIVGWPEMASLQTRAELMKRRWDRLILDEAHYAKNFGTKRTQAVFGQLDGDRLLSSTALVSRAKGVWCLTGTPLPHDPSDIYPMMRALCPERLRADPVKGWPDVTDFEAFRDRYCRWRPKKLSPWKSIVVVMGGKNEAELGQRLNGFFLRRTQQDVGIRAPIYETMPLAANAKAIQAANGNLAQAEILEAARSGETRGLEMHLGPLRRLTGEIKARAVVEAVKDEFESGLDRIVLAYWHKEVGNILAEGLATYGVARLDGSTSPRDREAAEMAFRKANGPRVFLGQIEAAGEAIDLSASATLWFVETVFSPKSMQQMSLRITNHGQTRQALVRVCVLEGSIDEALNEVLMRLWTSIREVTAQ